MQLHPDAAPSANPHLAIEVERLGRSFGDVVALDSIDLQVPTGSVLGLLGPNGAGKTTAVRILTTILMPTSGTAHVRGMNVVERPNEVRNLIGLAGQYAAVDENLTGRENLRMVARLTHQPKDSIRARVTELLTQFRLTDAADRPVRTYSGGMRRRLDLGAALVHRPPILFLDEPTTGLDPRSRTDLWGVIEDLVGNGTTVLLTTQYLDEADRLADNIAVIDHGRVIASGTAAELKGSLGSTVIEVVFDSPDAARHATPMLAPIGHGEPNVVTDTVSLSVDDGTAATFALVRALDDAGVTPESMTVREPSLNDVFLTLTGSEAT